MEALSGYLLIAERLLEERREFANAWNFGPSEDDAKPVAWIADRMLEMWGAEGWDRPRVSNRMKRSCSSWTVRKRALP